MPFLLVNRLAGDGERVGVAYKKIPIHVITRGDAGCGIMAGFESMARVVGDAPGIDESHRSQHCATVSVENYIFAYPFARHLHAYSLPLHPRGVRALPAALN